MLSKYENDQRNKKTNYCIPFFVHSYNILDLWNFTLFNYINPRHSWVYFIGDSIYTRQEGIKSILTILQPFSNKIMLTEAFLNIRTIKSYTKAYLHTKLSQLI